MNRNIPPTTKEPRCTLPGHPPVPNPGLGIYITSLTGETAEIPCVECGKPFKRGNALMKVCCSRECQAARTARLRKIQYKRKSRRK